MAQSRLSATSNNPLSTTCALLDGRYYGHFKSETLRHVKEARSARGDVACEICLPFQELCEIFNLPPEAIKKCELYEQRVRRKMRTIDEVLETRLLQLLEQMEHELKVAEFQMRGLRTRCSISAGAARRSISRAPPRPRPPLRQNSVSASETVSVTAQSVDSDSKADDDDAQCESASGRLGTHSDAVDLDAVLNHAGVHKQLGKARASFILRPSRRSVAQRARRPRDVREGTIFFR